MVRAHGTHTEGAHLSSAMPAHPLTISWPFPSSGVVWAMHSGCPHTHQEIYNNAAAWGRAGVMVWLEEDA
jgi:hypothetical protein